MNTLTQNRFALKSKRDSPRPVSAWMGLGLGNESEDQGLFRIFGSTDPFAIDIRHNSHER